MALVSHGEGQKLRPRLIEGATAHPDPEREHCHADDGADRERRPVPRSGHPEQPRHRNHDRGHGRQDREQERAHLREGSRASDELGLLERGGTVDITWTLASVTMPMSRVEIVVNGEVVRSESPGIRRATGHSSVHIERSSWIALLVRGHYRDKPEVIAAHSSPVIVEVKGSPFFAAADALTILDQIEGALTYLDTLGTRAEAAARIASLPFVIGKGLGPGLCGQVFLPSCVWRGRARFKVWCI